MKPDYNTNPIVLEKWIKELIEQKVLWKFYKSKWWAGNKEMTGLKNEILKADNYECQECKKKGEITKATTVHHIQFVRKYPRLALSKHYTYKGKTYRNLVSVCARCHNLLHPEKLNNKKKEEFNKERW